MRTLAPGHEIGTWVGRLLNSPVVETDFQCGDDVVFTVQGDGLFVLRNCRGIEKFSPSPSPALPDLSESDAARRFVDDYFEGVQDDWPMISGVVWYFFAREEMEFPDSPEAKSEFTVACLTGQVRALPNLLSQPQADRLRSHVFATLAQTSTQWPWRDIFHEYETAWSSSRPEFDDLPFLEVAAAFCSRVGVNFEFNYPLRKSGKAMKVPRTLSLLALTTYLIMYGGPWWKRVIQTSRLVT